MDGGIVLILIWGVFAVLVLFFSQAYGEILPYFIAMTLLFIVPFVSGILIHHSRHPRMIVFDGDAGVVSLKRIWRSRQVPFDKIREFQVNRYRFKRNIFLYRFEAVLSSGRVLRLIQDVPEKEALCGLAEKAAGLARKPMKACR